MGKIRMTVDALSDKLRAAQATLGGSVPGTYTHNRTGKKYVVANLALCVEPVGEPSVMVRYHAHGNGKVVSIDWLRPVEEFTAKFTPVSPTARR
jgi:hypothetical protein